MVNANLLRFKMAEKRITADEMAKRLDIARSTFYRKTSGENEFCASEIKKIMETLQIDDPVPIFFADEVAV